MAIDAKDEVVGELQRIGGISNTHFSHELLYITAMLLSLSFDFKSSVYCAISTNILCEWCMGKLVDMGNVPFLSRLWKKQQGKVTNK